jgi:hypothetical protein
VPSIAATPVVPLRKQILAAIAAIIVASVAASSLAFALLFGPPTRPALPQLRHLVCERPLGVRGGLSQTNFVLCDDGTKIPLNGASGRSSYRRGISASDEAYRCALIRRRIEVWSYDGSWPPNRIVQVSCGGIVTVPYQMSTLPLQTYSPTLSRLLLIAIGLFGLIVLAGLSLAMRSGHRYSTSQHADWHWPD